MRSSTPLKINVAATMSDTREAINTLLDKIVEQAHTLRFFESFVCEKKLQGEFDEYCAERRARANPDDKSKDGKR